MIITFILSQQNNIPRIKGLIRALSERYGKRKVTDEGRVYYTFPGVESLAAASEEELRELKLGYRSRYICGTAGMIAGGEFDIDSLARRDYPGARSETDAASGNRRKGSGLYLSVCSSPTGRLPGGYPYE